MNFRRIAIEGGAILHDPAWPGDPGQLFDAAARRMPDVAVGQAGGRGSVLFLDHGGRPVVLRRYLRGGLAARVSRDRYCWLGEPRTRGFRELSLLGELLAEGLPVPQPVAARYRRRGLTYSAELVTARLPASAPLAQRLLAGRLGEQDWQAAGRTIRRFHDAGVQHADLNAHNVMLGEHGEVWLLDFDRGRRRPPGPWRRRVLARLERSLAKTCRGRPDLDWPAGFALLVAAHDAGGAA